jgi:hypothetical protein
MNLNLNQPKIDSREQIERECQATVTECGIAGKVGRR